MTLLFEDGATVVARTFPISRAQPLQRGRRRRVPEAPGKRFGAVIESIGDTPAQLVVERAMYWNAGGASWAAGTNAVATRLTTTGPGSGPTPEGTTGGRMTHRAVVVRRARCSRSRVTTRRCEGSFVGNGSALGSRMKPLMTSADVDPARTTNLTPSVYLISPPSADAKPAVDDVPANQ